MRSAAVYRALNVKHFKRLLEEKGKGCGNRGEAQLIVMRLNHDTKALLNNSIFINGAPWPHSKATFRALVGVGGRTRTTDLRIMRTQQGSVAL